MFTAKQYVRPSSLEEAYELCLKKRNLVAGGMLWTKMYSKSYDTVIDLCDLGLDRIEETGDGFSVGAMVTLSALERHEGLNAYTNGALREALVHIVGTQFRNSATVGGSVWGRFGFSDVITILLILDARVELYQRGVMPLGEFMDLDRKERDILTGLFIPKGRSEISYLSQRNISTDIPVLTCATAKTDGEYECVIGARPMKAVRITDEDGILSGGITEENASQFAKYVVKHLAFGGNVRATAEYRRRVCEVLVRRALMNGRED